VLRRIFGSKQEEITEGWRKLYTDLHDFYSLLNRTLKSSIIWAGYVASIGEEECIQGYGGNTQRKEATGKT
jgi:hypothetical protein